MVIQRRELEEFKGEWAGLGNCLQNSQVGCPTEYVTLHVNLESSVCP